MTTNPRTFTPQLADLLGDVTREIDISMRSRIFCNRNLRMDSIEFIGFDMDYTLALYQQEALERLSIELTLGNLIRDFDFPEEIRALAYDSSYAVRGLVVDRRLGNVFKMDRHGHVGRVCHGFHQLTKVERRKHYRHERINPSHARYTMIDTLFALPEVVMYVTLVDYFDRVGRGPGYSELFDAIR
ncbi:MAG: 5'-nucleotidase domain-containing protein, partial [Myxococcota bacterium]